MAAGPVSERPGAPELAGVARLALTELEADAVVVTDGRSWPPRVVAREGAAAGELAAALDDLPGPADALDDDVVVSSSGGLQVILSAALTIDDGQAIGTLHAAYRAEAPALRRGPVRTLARAFARHLGVAMACGARRCEPDRGAVTRDRLDALDALARGPNALEELTAMVGEALRPSTGATAACITVWDEERDILRALPGAFGATDRALPASITGPVGNPRSNAARVFTTGRPYLTNHASGDPGLYQPYVDVFQLRRVLSVALNSGTQRIGVLILVNKPTDFTVEDIAAAESVAPRIAMAVELARSVARMHARQRLEAVLATTAVAVAQGQSVDDCLLPAFEQLSAVTDASIVGLIPRDGTPLIWRAGPGDDPLERRLVADARVLAQRSVGAFPQAAGDPGWAALHAPVELYGERIAALSILRRNGEPFRSDEAGVITRLASITALAWATERYQHQLAELARLRERERIADELHDRVAQILFAAQCGLDSMLDADADAPIDRKRIVEVRGLLIKGDGVIRDVIHRLAAPPDTSLTRRLRLEVESIEEEFGVAVHADLPDAKAIDGAPRPVADCLVKVAREAMVNAAKHAGPCRINLDVHAEPGDRLVMTVLDDGLGLLGNGDSPGRHGMRSLRRAVKEAGGRLRVSRAQDAFGTRVTASF